MKSVKIHALVGIGSLLCLKLILGNPSLSMLWWVLVHSGSLNLVLRNFLSRESGEPLCQTCTFTAHKENCTARLTAMCDCMIKSAEEWKVRLFNRVLQSYTCIINGCFFRSLGVWDLTTKSVEEENKRQIFFKKTKKKLPMCVSEF